MIKKIRNVQGVEPSKMQEKMIVCPDRWEMMHHCTFWDIQFIPCGRKKKDILRSFQRQKYYQTEQEILS